VLDKLLQYHQTPATDTFVPEVMKGIKRQQRRRQVILTGASVIGGLFGVAGAMMLSDPIGNLITQLSAGNTAMSVGLALMSGVAFLGWLLHDETRMSV
jgi:hypothetical protein